MEIETKIFNVKGMSCQHCVNGIKNAVGELKGIRKVEVNLEVENVIVELDLEVVTLATVKKTIEDQGYEVK
jgi:copper chaperone